MKPDKTRLDSYEYFVLGDSNNLKMTRMLKLTISRYISISGKLLFGSILQRNVTSIIDIKTLGPTIWSRHVLKKLLLHCKIE